MMYIGRDACGKVRSIRLATVAVLLWFIRKTSSELRRVQIRRWVILCWIRNHQNA